MSGHYCAEHKVVFFKRGAMRGYAHPIEGTDPTKWCNEPESGGGPIPEGVTPKPQSGEQSFTGEERGMWYKEIGKNYRADKLKGAMGLALMTAYWVRMFTVIGIEKPE